MEAVIKDLRKARIEARNKALPEFPLVVAVQGHDLPVQVTRSKAIEQLTAGSHKLAEQPEAGQ